MGSFPMASLPKASPRLPAASLVRQQRDVGGIEKPGRKQGPIALQKAREVGVEDVGDAVVVAVAARAAVRLHEGLGRLERVPPRVPIVSRSRPRIAEIRKGHLGDDLKAQEVVGKIDAFSQRGRQQHGGERRHAVVLQRPRLRLRRLHEDHSRKLGRRAQGEIVHEPARARVGRRVDEPFLVGMARHDAGDGPEEVGLQHRHGVSRQRPNRLVDDGALREREWRGAREAARPLRDERKVFRDDVAPPEIRRGEHDDVGGVPQEIGRHRRDGQGLKLEAVGGAVAVPHDPLLVLGVEKEAEPRQDAVQRVALGEQAELLAGGRKTGKVHQPRQGAEILQRTLDRCSLGLEPCHVIRENLPVRVRGRQMRETSAEPRGHLLGREADGEDAHQLRLEVVGLVHDEQLAAVQPLALPLSQGQEVRRIGAEDRPVERGGLGARIWAAAHGAAWTPAHALRRGDAGALVALARIVVAPLHDLDLAPEVALVLVLEELLGGEEIRAAAPARERHGDVALAHAGRGLDEEHARGGGIAVRLGESVGQLAEQTGLLGSGRVAGGKVRQQLRRRHARLAPAARPWPRSRRARYNRT
jgi:hypothetical protein